MPGVPIASLLEAWEAFIEFGIAACDVPVHRTGGKLRPASEHLELKFWRDCFPDFGPSGIRPDVEQPTAIEKERAHQPGILRFSEAPRCLSLEPSELATSEAQVMRFGSV